jgi:hypothetical protein
MISRVASPRRKKVYFPSTSINVSQRNRRAKYAASSQEQTPRKFFSLGWGVVGVVGGCVSDPRPCSLAQLRSAGWRSRWTVFTAEVSGPCDRRRPVAEAPEQVIDPQSANQAPQVGGAQSSNRMPGYTPRSPAPLQFVQSSRSRTEYIHPFSASDGNKRTAASASQITTS